MNEFWRLIQSHLERDDEFFVYLLLHLAGSGMDSEIAKAIAKEYPHDPLPPDIGATLSPSPGGAR